MKPKICSLILAVLLVFSLAACSVQGTNTPPNGNSDVPQKGSSVAAMMPCPLNMTPTEKDVYPYMGLSMELPDVLLNAVLDNVIFMRSGEDTEYTDLGNSGYVAADWRPTAENTIIHSGYIEFLYLPEAIRDRAPHHNMEDPMSYDEFVEWIKNGVPMAYLGMYEKAGFTEKRLDETGYTDHTKLGENENYVYYLSTNNVPSNATAEESSLYAALKDMGTAITVFTPRSVDDNYYGITTPEAASISSINAFQTETLDGKFADQTIFSEADVTMLNVWTTWCGACIEEMPELEELSKELKGTGAQVISIVADTFDSRKGVDQELVELAQQIVKRTGVTFPSLIPDASLKDGLLQGILGYPTTWFIDKQGNVIGEPVLGSNSKEGWLDLVQERLEEIQP